MGLKKQLLKHETAELAKENIRNDSFAQVCGGQRSQGRESGWLAQKQVAAGSSQPVLIYSCTSDPLPQRTFLSWVYPIIARGRKGQIVQDELKMPSDQACEAASAKFQVGLLAEVRVQLLCGLD
jgi:hypothetical protein